MEISIGKLKSSAWQLFSTWKLFVKVKTIHSAECNLERCHNLRYCHEKSRTIYILKCSSCFVSWIVMVP
jgi:hypothetical protein